MALDDATRRALHLDHRARSLQSRGIEVRTGQLEREVAEDLRLVDRARAEGAIKDRRKPKKRVQPARTTPDVARPELHAETLARKAGGEFFSRAEPNDRAPRLAKIKGVEAERHYALMRRMKLLSERGPGRIKADQTMEQGPWLYPDLARMVAMATVAFSARLGGYRDLNAEDRRRRYLRAMEDIANKSNAAVGVAWWCK